MSERDEVIADVIQRTEWDDDVRRRFLDHLAETGCPIEAARRSGIDSDLAFNQVADDPEFELEWEQAEDEADAALEHEARRRALEVIYRPLFYRGHPVLNPDGSQVIVKRYNDRMMVLMLELLN